MLPRLQLPARQGVASAAEPASSRPAHRAPGAALLLLAGWLGACSRTPSGGSGDPPGSGAAASSHDASRSVPGAVAGPGATGAAGQPGGSGPAETRLTAVPALDLFGLDPAAAEGLRAAAAELAADLERPALWTQLGVVLQAHRRFEAARTCYRQRLLRDERDAHTWYYLALVEDELGDTERAVELLERCAQLERGYVPIRWRLGQLWLRLGQLEPAADAFAAALALSPRDPAALVGMARVELQRQHPDQAARLLEGHLQRHPEDGNARLLLGTAYRDSGRAEDAARALAGVSGGEPMSEDPWLAEVQGHRQGFRVEFLAAVELLGRGQVEPAIERLEALHRRQPDDVLVLINLHRAYRLHGEPERAIELLLEARRIDPQQDIVHLHLAGAYRDLAHRPDEPDPRARLEAALESSQRACELSPTFPEAQGMRADVLADLGRSAEALEAYLLAAELAPDSAQWQERAGTGLCQAGRWGEAVAPLRRLGELEPGAPRVQLFLAAALANSGQLEEAHLALERGLALAPQDASLRKALADLERGQAASAAGASAGGAEGDGGG